MKKATKKLTAAQKETEKLIREFLKKYEVKKYGRSKDQSK